MLAALLAAQVVLPSGVGVPNDGKIEILARSNSNARRLLRPFLLEQSDVLGAFQRVGLVQGCPAFDQAINALAPRYRVELHKAYAQAIEEIVPPRVMADAAVVSFLIPPLSSYKARVDERAAVLAQATLAEARTEGQRAFLAAAQALPTVSADQATLRPKADLAKALNISGNWDLSKPTDVAMACADLAIAPALRPTISGGK